jgi:RNA polymerase sigma-70 factor (ECF subfamily)
LRLDEVLSNWTGPLRRFLLSRGLPSLLAEELVQEVATQAIASQEDFRSEAALFTWLCAIAKRKVADHFRRQQRHPEVVSLDGNLRERLALYSTERLPADVVEDEETRAFVRECLSQLSDDYALVLQLKYVEGWPVKKIAETLGRSEAATESLLTRAREQFRTVFLSSPTKEGNRNA